MTLRCVLASAMLMVTWICSSDAQAASERRVDIPAQGLGPALAELAKQTGVQVIYPAELVAGVEVPALAGSMTPQEALTRLLATTKLKYEFVDAETVTLMRVTAGNDAATAAKPATETTAPTTPAGTPARESATPQSQETSSPPPANPEDQAANRGGAARLSEIVVTAQKREQRLIDVPISVVAISAEELQQRKIANVEDLAIAVPGMSVASDGGIGRLITLRGMSNLFGNSSLVGVYLDEASITSTPFNQVDLRTYDLERVEVLRGPQGTLYGEGSVGGTVRFITKNPKLDQYATHLSVEGFSTEDGEPGERIGAVFNLPLAENVFGVRIAGTYENLGGWMDQPAAGKRDFNDQELVNVRAKGLWQPTPEFELSAMAVIHRNDAAPIRGEDASGNYTQVFNLTTTPSVDDDYDIYNLTLAYDFLAVRVLSTTSYVKQDKVYRDVGNRFQITPPGTPKLDQLTLRSEQEIETWTEELRLTSMDLDNWEWTLGGYYRHSEYDSIGTSIVGFPGPPGTPLPASFVGENNSVWESWAVFGDVSFRATDRLTLGTGLRYFEDRQESTQSFFGISSPTQTGRFDSVNPRAYLQLGLSQQVNVYLSAAKGFRSGGFNGLNQPSYDPESVWTYELGTKMSLLNERLSIDSAIFYSDYSDYQIVGILPPPAPPFGITSNAGDAKIRGIEGTIAWRPVEEWTFGLNASYLDTEFDEISATSTSHVVGDPLDFIPPYSFTASIQHDFAWGGKEGFARVDYGERDRTVYRIRSIGPWYFSESALINMLNFNFNLKWNDRLSLGVYGQNLLNERGYTDPFSIEETAARPRPRTLGISIDLEFD